MFVVYYIRVGRTEGGNKMTNYEMVELLRQKANVSYEEAKATLEAANWDLLDAIVRDGGNA